MVLHLHKSFNALYIIVCQIFDYSRSFLFAVLYINVNHTIYEEISISMLLLILFDNAVYNYFKA